MIEVRANGKAIRGFTSASIVRAMDQFAATYSIGVFRDSSAGDSSIMVPVFPDDEVEIYIDGELVVRGYNETTNPNLTASGFSCNVSGKEITVDAVKCPPEVVVFENKRVDEICRIISTGFDFVFDGAGGVNVGAPFKSLSLGPDKSAYEVMLKACQERRLMLVSDGKGHFHIDNGRYRAASVDLVQGKNVLSCAGKFSNENRYSKYSVFSSQDPSGKTYAEVIDEEVTRQRRWVIVDEQFATKENCEARAMWEAKHRWADANSFNIVVSGWRESENGPLWAPGTTVSVDVPCILGKKRSFLVNRVNYTFGSEGSQTTLNLVDPEVYCPMPTFASKKKVTTKKAQKDALAHVRKQTGSKLR